MMLSLFVSVALSLSHPRLKSASLFGAGVLLICAFLLPIVDIIGKYDVNFEIHQYMSTIESDTSRDMIETAFEDGICRYIADKYGVDPSLITVMADGFDLETMRAERIYVTLHKNAVWLNLKELKDELEREFTRGGECEVSLKLG